ncbi:hypothetical protein ACTG2C_01180 [Aeromonas veronii]
MKLTALGGGVHHITTVPEHGYKKVVDARESISEYLMGYYSIIRPHHYNGCLVSNEFVWRCWAAYKTVASFI